jgi:hypothetical protein
MDDVKDDNEVRFTIAVRYRHGDVTGETFNTCSEVEQDEDNLTFLDRYGKRHDFHGVSYHVAEE